MGERCLGRWPFRPKSHLARQDADTRRARPHRRGQLIYAAICAARGAPVRSIDAPMAPATKNATSCMNMYDAVYVVGNPYQFQYDALVVMQAMNPMAVTNATREPHVRRFVCDSRMIASMASSSSMTNSVMNSRAEIAMLPGGLYMRTPAGLVASLWPYCAAAAFF